MIKVYQNKFVKLDENGNYLTRGNCYAACLASILELKISDLPKFEDLPPDGSWFTETQLFLNKYNLWMDVQYDIPEYYSIAQGPSPRGKWGHAVVYFKDKLLHDPYPGGEGITKVEEYLVIKPLN